MFPVRYCPVRCFILVFLVQGRVSLSDFWSARSTIGPIEPVAKYERSVAQSGSFAWASRRAAVVGVSVVT